jgi:F-type H+-transporting ATPase subunit delta
MKSPATARREAKRLFRLCVVDGALDAGRARQVAQALVASGRRGTLAVLTDFHRRVRLDRDRHAAKVESAAPLPASVRTDVEAGLARIYGSRLETSFAESPQLIGGMRIRVASDVYDGSVRMRLAALAARE